MKGIFKYSYNKIESQRTFVETQKNETGTFARLQINRGVKVKALEKIFVTPIQLISRTNFVFSLFQINLTVKFF